MNHSCRIMNRMIQQAEKNGYIISKTSKKKSTIMIKNNNGSIGTFHISERGIHPLRRWLKKNPPN